MKSRESHVRLKQFQVNEKTRQLGQIQLMMAEMEKMAAELEYQIAAEEKKAGNYRSFPFRLSNLRQSRAPAVRQPADFDSSELKVQLDAAELALEEAQADYDKAAALEERDAGHRSNRAG
jgi:hypothetical protein